MFVRANMPKISFKVLLILFVVALIAFTWMQFTLEHNTTEHIQTSASHVATFKSVLKNKTEIVATAFNKYTNASFVTKVAVDTHGCDSWFEETFEHNLRVVAQYPRGNADLFMGNITGNLTKPKSMMTSFPVIATAASGGFYGVTQGLLRSIHEKLLRKYKNIKIVYYDLGLNENEVSQLNKYCKCEVRTFPFHNFPQHVRSLKTYTWKPIIIQTLLMEFGWVWWMDSSVRFKTDDLDKALRYSIDNSILFGTYDPVLSVAQHTDLQTMEYLHESPCKFRNFGEVEATFVLFHFDYVTHTIVNAWTTCALNKECMSPSGTESKLSCNLNAKTDGQCHRFDQSVLSMILRRLFHAQNNYPLNDTFQLHEILRGNSETYFPT